MRDIERSVALVRLDYEWKEHLRNMDELKESVQAASFEQKDPLVIYKIEAYKLFETLVYKMNQDITSYLSKGKLQINVNQEVREARSQRTDYSKTKTNRSEETMRRAAESAGRAEQPAIQQVRNTGPKIGRNDPCPCGSGKNLKIVTALNETYNANCLLFYCLALPCMHRKASPFMKILRSV